MRKAQKLMLQTIGQSHFSLFSLIFTKNFCTIECLNFLNENNLLFEMQYDFRPGRSCENALLQTQIHILEALNKKHVALLLLIDFSKAFDIVEHPLPCPITQVGPSWNPWRSFKIISKQYTTVC